jgi:hypothetical protein
LAGVDTALLPPANLATEATKQLEALVRRILGARRGMGSRVVLGDPAGRIVDAARRTTCVVMAT